jgi:hypothetical protein
MHLEETVKKVEVLNLSDAGDKCIYEALLNNANVTIIKEEFTYDKMSKALITVWYEVKEEA